MRDYTFGRKKAATSTFSHPSLVSPHTPTLANPVRGFGLPTNNVIQTQTSESTNQQEAQAAGEKSKLLQALEQPSFGHDISLSRIALRRPQAKLTVGEPGDKYEQEADWMANQVMRMVVPDKPNADSVQPVEDSLQRKCTACEQEEEKIQTKPSIQPAADGGSQAGDNITTLPEINIVAVPPASLRSDIGTMNYYRKRNTDFMSRSEPGETPPDYYLNYGDKYVNKFKTVLRPKLSSTGQKWLDCTLVALQTAIEDKRDANPWAFAEMERDNDKFRDFAYGTHSTTYVDCGVCELPIVDQTQIVSTPDIWDLLSLGGIGQILDSFAMCNAVWFYPKGP